MKKVFFFLASLSFSWVHAQNDCDSLTTDDVLFAYAFAEIDSEGFNYEFLLPIAKENGREVTRSILTYEEKEFELLKIVGNFETIIEGIPLHLWLHAEQGCPLLVVVSKMNGKFLCLAHRE